MTENESFLDHPHYVQLTSKGAVHGAAISFAECLNKMQQHDVHLNIYSGEDLATGRPFTLERDGVRVDVTWDGKRGEWVTPEL